MLLLAAGCGEAPGTPEASLREWVAEAEAAAEAQDRAALTALVSPSYRDARGNDRAAIDRLLRLYFLRQNDIALLVRIDSLKVDGASAAQLVLTVGMAESGQGTFNLNAEAYRFELELEARGGDWRLIGARWGELGENVH